MNRMLTLDIKFEEMVQAAEQRRQPLPSEVQAEILTTLPSAVITPRLVAEQDIISAVENALFEHRSEAETPFIGLRKSSKRDIKSLVLAYESAIAKIDLLGVENLRTLTFLLDDFSAEEHELDYFDLATAVHVMRHFVNIFNATSAEKLDRVLVHGNRNQANALFLESLAVIWTSAVGTRPQIWQSDQRNGGEALRFFRRIAQELTAPLPDAAFVSFLSKLRRQLSL